LTSLIDSTSPMTSKTRSSTTARIWSSFSRSRSRMRPSTMGCPSSEALATKLKAWTSRSWPMGIIGVGIIGVSSRDNRCQFVFRVEKRTDTD
jgi:hypothetical protein